MSRISFSGKGGVTKHSELTDVSTPHALADLVSAVCSETEAQAITVIMASNAEAALILEHSELTAAIAAAICENTDLTLTKAASIFNEAGLTAARAASILDEAGLTAARTASIFDEAGLTAANAALIFDEAGLAAQKAADIFDHGNLSSARALAIFVHANLSEGRQAAIIALMASPGKVATDATLGDWQANPATGTASTPQDLNDNDTGSDSRFAPVTDYAEVNFGKWVKIDQFRHFGHVGNNGDGVWKIEYTNTQGSRVDWKTGIAIRAAASWSGMLSNGEVVTRIVRLQCTSMDTGGNGSIIGELEVYHS